MKSTWYKDAGDIWFYEIVYKSYRRLSQLAEEHRKKGRRVWLNNWDTSKDEWVLTVEIGERK